VDEPLRCYRHPDRETYVSCTECGRGICPDCMSFGAVGIRCPEHAGVGSTPGRAGTKALRSPSRSFRQTTASLRAIPSPVTFALIVVNIGVYLVTAFQGAGINAPGGEIFFDWLLLGAFVAEGDWYRLVTATFLHGSIIHLLANMVSLWWLGSLVEQVLGSLRYLLLYFVSGLCGSAGALLLEDANVPSVGASGAVYGIMGALLIHEWLRTGSFVGPALTVIVLNLVFTFSIPGISIGGHLGGLAGGIAATLAMEKLRYGPRWRTVLGPALAALIGVAGIVVAYVRVESYPI
jgi:membrane associated rhomboid family serine protease